jgi:hypothetical protein
MGGYKQLSPIPERGQLFIPADDETFSVAMCVCNPDRSSLGINRRDPAQAESSFAEIVSDYFPVFHLELCSRHCLLFKTSPNDSEQHAGNDSSPSQEGFMEIKLTCHHQLCRAGRVFPL